MTIAGERVHDAILSVKNAFTHKIFRIKIDCNNSSQQNSDWWRWDSASLLIFLPTNQVRRYHGHKLLNTADNNMIDPKQCSFVDSRDDDASSIRPRSLCDNGDDDVSVESVASVSSWISVSCSNWCAHLTICFAIQTNWLTQTSNILVYLDQSFATSDSINARTDKPAGEEIAHDH
jgi:hypothetical protein